MNSIYSDVMWSVSRYLACAARVTSEGTWLIWSRSDSEVQKMALPPLQGLLCCHGANAWWISQKSNSCNYDVYWCVYYLYLQTWWSSAKLLKTFFRRWMDWRYVSIYTIIYIYILVYKESDCCFAFERCFMQEQEKYLRVEGSLNRRIKWCFVALGRCKWSFERGLCC